MKSMEVTHTLRLYDPEFVAKLGELMEREQKHFKTKNEFMTAIVKMGYERYVSADKTAKSHARFDGAADAEYISDTLEALRGLLEELSRYITMKFKHIHISLSLAMRILSAVYNMSLGSVGGKVVPAEKVEDGFFDDLPARFEKIVVKLEQEYGLKT